jgi:hypothetical protein
MSAKFGVFNPFRGWKRGDFPMDPTVEIVVHGAQKREDGRVSLTATLASDEEIDYTVDELRQSLESARREAKRTLKKQRDKIRGILEE